MQEHAEIGAKILADGKFPILRLARVVALTHHERWDGTGYPYRLAGKAIPLAGRITAVADVLDALTHERPYKPAWALSDAVAEIERLAGEHFDPDVVAAFLALDHRLLLEPLETPGGPDRSQAAAPVRASDLGRHLSTARFSY